MHVRFERSGGFAGITLKSEFDSTNLSVEQTSDLQRLINEAGFFELPEVIRNSKSGADRFHYTIAVDTGTQKHAVECDENSLPENARPLFRWLVAEQRSAIAAQKQR